MGKGGQMTTAVLVSLSNTGREPTQVTSMTFSQRNDLRELCGVAGCPGCGWT